MGIVGSPMGVKFDKKVKFTFPDSLITQPLIYEMSQIFDVVTNIEKANVGEKEGWVVLGLRGTGSDIDNALEWMTEQGVCIQMMFPSI